MNIDPKTWINYKIILIINNNTKRSVCQEYYYREIDLNRSVIECGKNLRIVCKDGFYFEHEKVKSVEYFEKYGYKITTTKKVWFIH